MGFGEVAMAALYFVLRFGLAFSDRLGGGRLYIRFGSLKRVVLTFFCAKLHFFI